ncbi:MAG: hypothetical protein BWK76_17585 [Desulfobulbaceae bacterium A2]|nr:MAG: hypothetical protein BWK76_17585 [Desulfobulbaceae bacterium A2]
MDTVKHKKRQGRAAWGGCFLLWLALLSQPNLAAAAEMVSISADGVRLLSQAKGSAEALWEFDGGYPLKVMQKQGDWLKVKDFENDSGWVRAKQTSKKRYIIVSANRDGKDKINIRQGAGTTHGVVARASYGVVLEVLEIEKNWVKVRHEKGVTGWVNRLYVWGTGLEK